jgi:imidazoleglycerol-phosphate dehydratase/histidinol-phosphatase
VKRQTSETNIGVRVNLDGDPAASSISTGIGFFDHMLAQLSRHGGMELQIKVSGDLYIDEHHTIEDTALALGQALRLALGDRYGIERYSFVLPMDETLVTAALDLSGRPYLVFNGDFPRAQVGGMPSELVPHFFRSFCETLGANLHIEVKGDNTHHMIEGVFKAVSRCLRQAVRQTSERSVPSTKGVL